MQPVRAYHLILTAYGFWLPNDPRGSWSDFVRAFDLFVHGGPATKVDTRRSLAKQRHDPAKRKNLKKHLARQPVRFTGLQARAIARGFADYARRVGLVIHACAIMPDHAHLVIARHTCSIESVATQLKGAATSRLTAEGLHPFAEQPYRNGRLPTPWARKCWSCFLWTDAEIRHACDYTNANPEKAGFAPQPWNFVTPFPA